MNVVKPLIFVGNIRSEQQKFDELRLRHPEKCKELFTLGETLVELSLNGHCGKVKRLFGSKSIAELPYYFFVKMFHASLINSHLMLAKFYVDQGFPINNPSLPNAMHVCLNQVEDFAGIEIVEFLAKHDIDIDVQCQKSYETGLHIAIRRSLFNTAKKLVSLGADVNAVAKNDVMPLNLAYCLIDSSEQRELTELLISKGARDTWRKDIDQNASVFSSMTENSTLISCSSIPTTDKPKVVMKRFVGGGGFTGADFTLFSPQTIIEESKQESNSTGEKCNNESSVLVGVSDDGGMMFSTG